MKSLYFTEEHEMFRQSLKDFIKKEVTPHIPKWEKARQIDRSIWQKMGEMGYLGINHKEAYGGMDLDFFYSVVWLEEMAKCGSGGFTAAVSVHQYMATNHIAMAGSEYIKENYLKPAIMGEKIGAIAISEPNAGSDVAGLLTTAKRDGDYFIVNGAKTFITNGYYADFVTTAVKTEKGISLLVIDGDAEGFTRTKLEKMGWHCSDTGELAFDNVRVPIKNLVGQEGRGFHYIMDSFQLERLVAGIMGVAGMEYAMQETLQYMSERKAFGRSINKFQVLRHRFANLATEIESAKQFVHHTCWLHKEGQFAVKQCSMVKLLTSELGKRVVDECLQSFGGYGYMEEYPIARAYRDARVGTIVGGTSEIMREIIAKMIFDEVNYKPVYKEEKTEVKTLTARSIVLSLSERFRPEKAKEYSTLFHFDIAGHDGGQFSVNIAEGACAVQEGLVGEAKCLISTTDEVYAALETGQKDPQAAFMSGEIQISNIGEMMQFTRLFKRVEN